jgi:hypothetical protein
MLFHYSKPRARMFDSYLLAARGSVVSYGRCRWFVRWTRPSRVLIWDGILSQATIRLLCKDGRIIQAKIRGHFSRANS